jgi:hypothetical protein
VMQRASRNAIIGRVDSAGALTITQGTLVRSSNMYRVNIPLASTESDTMVKDLRQTSNVKPGLESECR